MPAPERPYYVVDDDYGETVSGPHADAAEAMAEMARVAADYRAAHGRGRRMHLSRRPWREPREVA